MKIQLINEKELPYEFKYCEAIKKIVDLELVNLRPWRIIDAEWFKRLLPEMQRLYPKRKLIPFASNRSNSDLACFEIGKAKEVQIIHFGASEGWEQMSGRKFSDFWAWFKDAIDEMILFD